MGYLIESGKQSQTVRSYVSALRGILAEDKIRWSDDSFLLAALTRVCKFKNDTPRVRLPIRKAVLKVLIQQAWDHFDFIQQPYLSALYAALLSTTYFGLFRIGEVTSGSHPVKVGDVHLAKNKLKVLFILRSSKTHGEYSAPQSIKISSSRKSKSFQRDDKFCPYSILHTYITARPHYKHIKETFFVFSDNSPVRPEQFRRVLKDLVKISGFDNSGYEVHNL